MNLVSIINFLKLYYNLMKKNIVITGGSGRFGQYLKETKTKYKLFFPNKKKIEYF